MFWARRLTSRGYLARIGRLGRRSLLFGERLKLFFGGWRGEEAHSDKAEEADQKSGKDSVTLGDDRGKVAVDEGGVPENGDGGPGGDAGDGTGGSGAPPEERGEYDRCQCGGIDSVSVKGLLEDGVNVHRLVERPDAEQNDHEAGDDEGLFVGSFGDEITQVDVIDQVGSRGEEPVVGGGDDLGEDGAHKERAEKAEGGGAGEAMQAEVGENLAGAVMDLATREEDGACDGEGDNDGLENDSSDDPANNGTGCVLFGLGGEEFLIHGLVAKQEEAGGKKDFEALDGGEITEELEMGGGKVGVDCGPATSLVHEDGECDTHGKSGEQADGDVHIGDGGHAGNGSKEDDKGSDDVSSKLSGDEGGEDEVEDVAAADELVAGDGSVGEENGDDPQDAGSLVVPGLEQVGDGELGEFARARSDKVD